MEEFRPTGVKDVSANEFIATYAAHLKSNDKVMMGVKGVVCVLRPVHPGAPGCLGALAPNVLPLNQASSHAGHPRVYGYHEAILPSYLLAGLP